MLTWALLLIGILATTRSQDTSDEEMASTEGPGDDLEWLPVGQIVTHLSMMYDLEEKADHYRNYFTLEDCSNALDVVASLPKSLQDEFAKGIFFNGTHSGGGDQEGSGEYPVEDYGVSMEGSGEHPAEDYYGVSVEGSGEPPAEDYGVSMEGSGEYPVEDYGVSMEGSGEHPAEDYGVSMEGSGELPAEDLNVSALTDDELEEAEEYMFDEEAKAKLEKEFTEDLKGLHGRVRARFLKSLRSIRTYFSRHCRFDCFDGYCTYWRLQRYPRSSIYEWIRCSSYCIQSPPLSSICVRRRSLKHEKKRYCCSNHFKRPQLSVDTKGTIRCKCG